MSDVHPMTDACIQQAAKTANLPFQQEEGHHSVAAIWQEKSPAVVIQWNTALDKNNNLVLKWAAVQNLTDAPILGYQLGWMLIYTNKDPEVHLLEPTLKRLGSKQIDEVGESLSPSENIEDESADESRWANSGKSVLPPVVETPDLRAVLIFVASVKRQNAPDFIENIAELSAQQKARFVPAKAVSPN
jgi:hypothetical protein